MMHRLFVLIALQVSLAACVLPINPAGNAASSETQAACQPSKIQKSKNEFLEIQGSMKSEARCGLCCFLKRRTRMRMRKLSGGSLGKVTSSMLKPKVKMALFWRRSGRSITEAPIGSVPARNGEPVSIFQNQAVGRLPSRAGKPQVKLLWMS